MRCIDGTLTSSLHHAFDIGLGDAVVASAARSARPRASTLERFAPRRPMRATSTSATRLLSTEWTTSKSCAARAGLVGLEVPDEMPSGRVADRAAACPQPPGRGSRRHRRHPRRSPRRPVLAGVPLVTAISSTSGGVATGPLGGGVDPRTHALEPAGYRRLHPSRHFTCPGRVGARDPRCRDACAAGGRCRGGCQGDARARPRWWRASPARP